MIGVKATVEVLAFVVAIAAAVYSTWSPCGQSMLSQLNPVSERARGQRYAVTATWFVVGALAGGATLGSAMLALAFAVEALGVEVAVAAGATAVIALLGAASDAHVLPWSPPFNRRQVNEDWLPRYRGWLYGVGFGWQIGTGVATYIMTAAVFVMIAVGALTGSPIVAFTVAIVFALARGLVVSATARFTSFDALATFHRRFHRLGPIVQRAVIAVQIAVAIVAATAVWGWIGLVASAAVAVAGSLVRRTARRDADHAAPIRTRPEPVATAPR
jgi:hypothetical protein